MYPGTMTEPRSHIPEEIKREVRQRCGFGCVICGIPIYEYDHIVPHSITQEHVAGNLTLLCPTHHAEKTRGLLSEEKVRRHNASPSNVIRGGTSPHRLHYSSDSATIVIGGNRTLIQGTTSSALRIDDLDVVSFELVDGSLLLNLDIRGDAGNPALKIVRNEMVHSTHAWDYKFVGRRLTIRRNPREILCRILFDTVGSCVVFESGSFSHNGIDVLLSQESMCILNNRSVLSGNVFSGTASAIQIGRPDDGTYPTGIYFEIDRSPYDRETARAWARRELRQNRQPNN